MVTLDEPAGEPDTITESEMTDYRNQIMQLSDDRKSKRKSLVNRETPLVSIAHPDPSVLEGLFMNECECWSCLEIEKCTESNHSKS